MGASARVLRRACALAEALALAVGRPVPAAVTRHDPQAASRVIAIAADTLDVAPKRVREVLRAAVCAAIEAGVSFDALARDVAPT